MGFGIILIPLAILVYIPFLIWSVYYYLKTKDASRQEAIAFASRIPLKQTIVLCYVVAVLSNDNFIRVIRTIIDAIGYGIIDGDARLSGSLIRDLKWALLSWDDLYDIAWYWATIVAAFAAGMAIAFLAEKFGGKRLYRYNIHKLAFFNLFIHPFITLSIIGRLFRW